MLIVLAIGLFVLIFLPVACSILLDERALSKQLAAKKSSRTKPNKRENTINVVTNNKSDEIIWLNEINNRYFD